MAFVLLLVVPTLEIAVIVAIGRVIGGWPTIGLLLLESAIGAWLVKREGRAAWASLRGALASGRLPAGELSDAALVLVGGTLLLTPGFLSDVLGFACILPGTRGVARRLLSRVITRQLLASAPGIRVRQTYAGGASATPPGAAAPGPGATTRGAGPGATRATRQDDDVIEGEVL
ncbi:FxsA family protein [Arsenicicoccus dermatophilus]|uniref:FxsA family protein n=1 Tax=Arsenicicoccus dermatophilus TaxID=1076331 RepID=UPI001F4D0120|nr:FxsA family protein [Arsenicicoccus dermatophilus]